MVSETRVPRRIHRMDYWPDDTLPCSSASNRIIHAKDHASVQLSIVDVDPETGRQTDGSKTYAICGEIRRMGESDDCIVRLAKKDGIITKWVCARIPGMDIH